MRPYVASKVRRARRMPVDVAIEAGYSAHAFGFLGLAVRGCVELLLRKLGDEQAQPVELFRIEDPVEELVEIVDRHGLTFGYIAKVGPSGQKERRRKLRQELLRQI